MNTEIGGINTDVFREEAAELLSELESSLLELEERPDDQEIVGRVFRAMHTIKGSGAMFGFDDIASFTHDIETVYDLVRNNKIGVTKKLIDLTLKAADRIKSMLDCSIDDAAKDEVMRSELTQSFLQLIPLQVTAPEEQPGQGTKQMPGNAQAEEVYRIRFVPPGDLLLRGIDPLGMIEELRSLGECKIIAQAGAIPLLEECDPERCYMGWDIVLTTDRGIDAIRDVFIFVEEDSEIVIEAISTSDPEGEVKHKKIGEILVERGDIGPEDLHKVLAGQKMIGEMLVETGAVHADKIESALAEQRSIKELRKKRATEETASIKVASEKLDILVNLVGELVTVQAHLSETAGRENNARLTAIAEEVERLTAELRDNTMSMRMLPIGTTFARFRRLVRDLSNELSKDIEMVTEGAETELDKTVIEKLNDPLVHLIRNSIDHGIELPEARQAKGKPAKGTIHLSALHSGANVIIRIRDDGAGLDKEAIKEKAIQKGLLTTAAELSDKEIFSLIFEPGFSTAESITSVSGRGVGMDVVRQAIESLRGSISLESRPDWGTEVTLKLPLTLAIIDGLLVTIGEDYYVVPLSSVSECVELTTEDRMRAHGRDIADVRGKIVPYIRLRDRFEVRNAPPSIEQIVICDVEGRTVGLVVDSVIGGHQTVIKSLGGVYRTVDEISGATILGDGTVALIIDVIKVMHASEAEETMALAQVERRKNV